MIIGKILGKIAAYVGLITAIAGVVHFHIVFFLGGIIILTIGCILHEVEEQ